MVIQVHARTIARMTEEQLRAFMPKIGHRIDAIEIAKQLLSENNNLQQPTMGKSNDLLANLQRKYSLNLQSDGYSSTNKLIKNLTSTIPLSAHKATSQASTQIISANRCGNRNAEKSSRIIHIGWLMFSMEDGEYHRVQKDSGGGIRSKSVSKTMVKADIKELALSYFFKDGKSSKYGYLDDYEMNILNDAKEEFPDDLTVGDMFTQTGFKVITYYLATKEKKNVQKHIAKNYDAWELQESVEHF